MMTTRLLLRPQTRAITTALIEGRKRGRNIAIAAGATVGTHNGSRSAWGCGKDESGMNNAGMAAATLLAVSAACHGIKDECSASTADQRVIYSQSGAHSLQDANQMQHQHPAATAGGGILVLADRYQVDPKEFLGAGAFGTVHPAKNVATNERVALKRIPKRQTDPVSFRQEAEALRRIADNGGHPNICSLEDQMEDIHNYYLVFELARGGELLDHINDGVFSEVDAQRAMRQIASALEFLHGMGIVHADVKPENLLLSSKDRRDGSMKMIDFGCAVVPQDESSDGDETTPTPERPSKSSELPSSGTIAYWSPERFVSPTATPDSATDMWSVGVILYILLTGRHPFDVTGQSTDEQIEKRIKADPRPPMKHTSHISPEAVNLIERLLVAEPRERMTAEEMLRHPWICGK